MRCQAAICMMALATMTATWAQTLAHEVRTVAKVDLARYAGQWYEIARIPNGFEAKCLSEVSAEYRPRADGRIEVVNRCRRSDRSFDQSVGVAKIADRVSHAKLKVRFAPAWLAWLPQVWGDYWIVALAPDYSYAVVGDPQRRYLWVLARRREMTDGTYREALRQATEQGFDVSKLVKTQQQTQSESLLQAK